MVTNTNLKYADSSLNYYVIIMVQKFLKFLNSKISKENSHSRGMKCQPKADMSLLDMSLLYMSLWDMSLLDMSLWDMSLLDMSNRDMSVVVENLEFVEFRCFSGKIRKAIEETDLIELIPEYVGRENPVIRRNIGVY